jgi:hypothetical protein
MCVPVSPRHRSARRVARRDFVRGIEFAERAVRAHLSSMEAIRMTASPARAVATASIVNVTRREPDGASLVHGHVGLLQPIYQRFLLGSDLCVQRCRDSLVEHQQLVD